MTFSIENHTTGRVTDNTTADSPQSAAIAQAVTDTQLPVSWLNDMRAVLIAETRPFFTYEVRASIAEPGTTNPNTSLLGTYIVERY